MEGPTSPSSLKAACHRLPAEESRCGAEIASIASHATDGDGKRRQWEFTQGMRFSLLHLSDLHLESEASAGALLGSVSAALKDYQNQHTAIRAIAISGDLVDSPSKAAYAAVRSFIKGLETGFPTVSVVICPGNHDYRRSGVSPEVFARGRKLFREYLGHWFRHVIVPECSLLLYSLSSCEGGSAAQGAISETAPLELHSYLQGSKDARSCSIRVAIVHHHVLPVRRAEESPSEVRLEPFMVMRNPGHLIDCLLENQFSVLLHGHKHAQSDWTVSREVGGKVCALHVSASGSAK